MGGWGKLAAQTAGEVLKSGCSKMVPRVEKHRGAGAGCAPYQYHRVDPSFSGMLAELLFKLRSLWYTSYSRL